MTKYTLSGQKSETFFFAFLDELDHSTHFKKSVEKSTKILFFLLCILPLPIICPPTLNRVKACNFHQVRGSNDQTWSSLAVLVAISMMCFIYHQTISYHHQSLLTQNITLAEQSLTACQGEFLQTY